MPETKQLLRETRDRIAPPTDVLGGLDRRRRHKENAKRAAAAAVAIVVALLGFGGWFLLERDGAPKPANRSELGIFAPVSGRIVYTAKSLWVADSMEKGVLAVDPNGPSDTVEGPKVADDVSSTLVRLDLGEDALPPNGSGDGVEPLGWSSDGTELLVTRWEGFEGAFYLVHADGTETRLSEKSGVGARTAAISPDGSRVAFESEGLTVVDVEGGGAVKLPTPAEGEPSGPLTFSPDGTQIAYLAEDGVWVVNADGTDAHEILANEATRKWVGWFSGMQWSPAGDRIAIGLGDAKGSDGLAIYTFAPDGSDFTKVITGGRAPYWSPDGSQIAYTIPCEERPTPSCPEGTPLRSLVDPQPGDPPTGLAIADADGSNVRAYGFAASGPWHPGSGGPRDDQDVRDLTFDGKDVLERISDGEIVNGWPTTVRNRPGLYSLDGNLCGSSKPYCAIGFMHNGYGSGDVEIRIRGPVLERAVPDDATALTVAERDAFYRRIDARKEEWILDMGGTQMFILLEARPGTTQADLADAYAIIGSIRVGPSQTGLGYSLIFALTNNDWDSG